MGFSPYFTVVFTAFYFVAFTIGL